MVIKKEKETIKNSENLNEDIEKEGEMAKGCKRTKSGKCRRKPQKRLISKRTIRKFFGG